MQNSDKEKSKPTAYPSRLLTFIILLTALALGYLGWGMYEHLQREIVEEMKNVEIERLRGKIYHFDEIVTMSARAYVLSGKEKWLKRYREYVPQLNLMFEQIIEMAGEFNMKVGAQIQEVHGEILKLENEAIRLSEEGDGMRGREILFSPQYEDLLQSRRDYALQAVRPSHSEVLLEYFKEEILYLNEALTMSTVMAAYTNDLKWEERYQKYNFELERIIREIKDLAPDAEADLSSKMIEDANSKLVEMEIAVFENVKAQNLQEAREILESSDYQKQKEIYLLGLMRFSKSLSVIMRDIIYEEWQVTIKHLIIVGVIVVLVLLLWLNIWRLFRNWQETIIYKNLGLNRLNKTLDEKVNSRTQELQTQQMRLELANKDLKKNEEALRFMYKDIKTIHENYKQTQSQLIQSEKLASIGQLAAGVAHEINNPIGFISSNIQSMGQYVTSIKRLIAKVDELKGTINEDAAPETRRLKDELQQLEEGLNLKFIAQDMVDLLKESSNGIDRIKGIVTNLKTFARKDTDETSLINVQNVLEEVLNVLWNELKYTCEIVKDYAPIPLVKCNPQKLGQVFMNLLLNAKQAIKGKGKITIHTHQDATNVFIDIIDTGEGIPPEIITKIFDPFFTTKPVGLGTGLGLSISMDILKSFNGDLKVVSTLGKGSTFTVILPIKR